MFEHVVIITALMLSLSLLELTYVVCENLPFFRYLEVSKFYNLIHELLLVNIKEFIVNDYNMSLLASNFDQILNTSTFTCQEKVFLRESLTISQV